MDHNNLENSSRDRIPDHLICLLRNLYAGQGATVRTAHETADWFQTGKGVGQGCILSPCLFNLCAEYITRNAGLGEAQVGIKIAARDINNLRYADDTTLMAKSKEELKRLLKEVKEESEKADLKLNIQNMKIMTIQSHLFRVNRWGNNGNSSRLLLLGPQKSLQTANTAMKLKDACSMTNLESILKSRDISFPTKVHSQNYGFSSSHIPI